MIEGIEILSQVEVGTNTSMDWVVFGLFTALFFIIGTTVAVMQICPTGIEWLGCILIGLLVGSLGCLFGGLVGREIGEPTEFETHYKVMISDEVQMNEFFERYEIIEQDGKIYTIREKTNESD
jgi:hypothetical protein